METGLARRTEKIRAQHDQRMAFVGIVGSMRFSCAEVANKCHKRARVWCCWTRAVAGEQGPMRGSDALHSRAAGEWTRQKRGKQACTRAGTLESNASEFRGARLADWPLQVEMRAATHQPRRQRFSTPRCVNATERGSPTLDSSSELESLRDPGQTGRC